MPIFLAGGSFFGTLCAIDPRPAKLNRPEIIGMFKNFAQLIAFHLEAQDRAARQDAALLSERQTAELREQFIAVLGTIFAILWLPSKPERGCCCGRISMKNRSRCSARCKRA